MMTPVIPLAWTPLAFVAAATTVGATVSVGDIAAILGAAAAVISAVTGLVIAVRRKDGPVIIVTPEEAAQMDLTPTRRTRRRRR